MKKKSLFENEIAKLEAEIQLAEKNLIDNVTHLSISKYFLDSSNLEAIISSTIQNPKQIIYTLDSLARLSLDDDNLLRVGSKYANAILKASEILRA